MQIDPHMISLYTLAHDWWGVAAFGFGIYKVLNYLKSFKDNTEEALKISKEIKADMANGRISIRSEIKDQTESVVGALTEGLTELRHMIFTMAQHQPRPVRARTVTTTKQVDFEPKNHVDKAIAL